MLQGELASAVSILIQLRYMGLSRGQNPANKSFARLSTC